MDAKETPRKCDERSNSSLGRCVDLEQRKTTRSNAVVRSESAIETQ